MSTITSGYYLVKESIEYTYATDFDVCRSVVFARPNDITGIRGTFSDYLDYATLIYPTEDRNDILFAQLHPEYLI